MNDEFIESVITPKSEEDNVMVYRTFHGMEAVAQFEEDYNAENEGEN